MLFSFSDLKRKSVMSSSDPKKQVFGAPGAVIISLGLYKLLGNLIRGMFANFYIAHVVSEFFFALLVTIAVIVLKRKGVCQADWSLLKQGWSAAGAGSAILRTASMGRFRLVRRYIRQV